MSDGQERSAQPVGAKVVGKASAAASTGRTDAITGGIAKTAQSVAREVDPMTRRGIADVVGEVEPEGSARVKAPGKRTARGKAATAAQAASALVAITANAADDADENDDIALPTRDGADGILNAARNPKGTADETQRAAVAKRAATAENGEGAARKAQAAKRRMQSRRTWLKAREAKEGAAKASEPIAAKEARRGTAKAIASAASSAAVPIAGVLAGFIAIVLAALVASQLASALLGFWENEAARSAGTLTSVEREIAAALKGYGFSDEATAAILGNLRAESGMDPASDEVMDGMFNYAYERACGVLQYTSTRPGQGEYWEFKTWCRSRGKTWSEVGSQMEWTFSGNCPGTWSNRWSVNLVRSGYYSNCPGYTDGSFYVTAEEFKSADDVVRATYSWMACYEKPANGGYAHLDRRIEYAEGYLSALKSTGGGNAIVAAAESQLGVPYVWGGETPGKALDCSGLVQYCYAQAGISLPHYSEDQAAGGERIPLSEARPGDILWRPGHVAIYTGGDGYIHEPQSGDVCRRATGIAYFTCAIRY